MSGVEIRIVAEGEEDLRLDRWFRVHFPQIGHGRLQKLLRTGQVRVDGRRAKGGVRLHVGAQIRVPPLSDRAAQPPREPRRREVSPEDAAFVQSLVLYRDADVIALNKPPGLAAQGGTGTFRHLDGMLPALRFEAEEAPRLVHRLDRDTGGVLLLGRSRAATAALGTAFRSRVARKLYWAATVGVPEPPSGKIDRPIAKLPGAKGERMAIDSEAGHRALTLYAVMETAGRRLAWVALWPRTGRTHQLRVHCQALGCPILGDGKYGGAEAFVTGHPVSRKLHLHARALTVPHPTRRGDLTVIAPLSLHMAETCRLFGFDPERTDDPFVEAS